MALLPALIPAMMLLAALAAQPAAAQAQYSNVWGVNGEQWRASGLNARVSDHSYAGAHFDWAWRGEHRGEEEQKYALGLE